MSIDPIIASRSVAALGQNMLESEKGSLLGRHVAWLKQERSGISKIASRALMGLECLVCTLSFVGIPLLFKASAISDHLNAYRALTEQHKTLKPPAFEKVVIKTKQQTFNHVNYYAIHEGKLWFKPIHVKNADWELFYFDGYEKGENPIEIHADGANLMVRDDKNVIHYKKVLAESRSWLGFGDQYSCRDITKENNWESAWFTFPLFHFFYNLRRQKKISLPENTKCWTMCHRGDYAYYFTAKNGGKHKEFSMVTTLFAVTQDGKIHYADPYLVGGFSRTIEPPKNFEIENISASGSTILLIGRNTRTGKKVMYTQMNDWDLNGSNPFLPAHYSKNWGPSHRWRKHKMTCKDDTPAFGSHATIFQTGEGGSGARMLRIDGVNGDNVLGYYEKKINEKRWRFVPLH